MSTKKTSVIVLIAILILGTIGYTYYKMVYVPAQVTNTAKSASPSTLTAMVQQGDLSIYSRGTGILIARDEINLGFGTGGPIGELNVRSGDHVHKGNVLAIQGNLERYNAAVAADQISVLNAKLAIQSLQDNAAVMTAQAQLDVVTATVALNTAKNKWQVSQPGFRATSLASNTAHATLILAEASLNSARVRYNALSDRPVYDLERAQAQLDLAAAQKVFDAANNQVAWYNGKPTKVQQAQLDAEVALAEAHLAEAQLKWEKVKNGPDPDQIALAKLQLASAEANLALSKRNLEASTIVAPMDGTILSVSAKVGDDVSTPFISMADLHQRILKFSIDAAKIDKISAGYKVEVIFDALPNQVFTGSVIQIDPNLYTPTGTIIAGQTPGQIAVVQGLVSLDTNAMTAINNLPLGMTATVDVIGGQAKGVVLIPVEALQKQSSGKYTVFVMENGKQVLRPVEVGLMNSAFAEIKSGLKVGEIVVTSPVNTK